MIEVFPQWYQLHVIGENIDRQINVSLMPAVALEAGIQGLPGPPGPGATSYDHVQLSAVSEWIVNHNLGRLVHVTVLNAGGSEVEVEVSQISENQIRIYFNQPQTGKALVR